MLKYPKEVEIVHELTNSVVAGMVSKEAIGGSPFADKGLEGTEKSLGAGNGFNVNHMRLATKEDLSLCVASIQSRDTTGMDLVCEQIIIQSKDIKGQIGCVPMLEQVPIG